MSEEGEESDDEDFRMSNEQIEAQKALVKELQERFTLEAPQRKTQQAMKIETRGIEIQEALERDALETGDSVAWEYARESVIVRDSESEDEWFPALCEVAHRYNAAAVASLQQFVCNPLEMVVNLV